MAIGKAASQLARLMKRKKDIELQIKKLRDQGGAKATPTKPSPDVLKSGSFDREKKVIMDLGLSEAAKNRAFMNLAQKYRRSFKIAGKAYKPKDMGPPTRGGRTPMKKGGMTKKKGMAKGGAMKKKGYSKSGLKPAPNKGAASLPKAVRNKMGFMKKGGMTKKKGMARGGMKKKGYAKGGSAKRSKK
tara:strand:+ start:158 stop:718 length:561 start_codon:yes stop_codon:yes gene_type:complete